MKPVPAKLFFPSLAAALLLAAFPLFAEEVQEAQECRWRLRRLRRMSLVVRYHRGRGPDHRGFRAKTRHTTVIVLPAAEDILDFVVGDSEYWHLTGAANLAFLKPIAEGVTTNVALVCESGRIYSFLVTEGSTGEPHLIVRVEHPEIDDPRISPGVNTPAFVRAIPGYGLSGNGGNRHEDRRHGAGGSRGPRCRGEGPGRG